MYMRCFLDRANERIKNHHLPHSYSDFCACFKDREGIVINTIHGIKGEEYTTVIAFDLLNGHLPHWDYVWNEDKKPMRKRETLKLLYVLCSRAKKNLFLFSEKGRITKKGYMLVPTDELNSISYDYDTQQKACISKYIGKDYANYEDNLRFSYH